MKVIDTWLMQLHDEVGSDLFITVDAPPCIKVHGKIRPISTDLLTAEKTREIVLSVMSERQKEEFRNTQELQFAYSLGAEVRYRMSAFFQQGMIGRRQRQPRSSHHDAGAAGGGHQTGARALQGRRPDVRGRDRRPDRAGHRLGGGDLPARQGRQAARDRGHRRSALARDAGGAGACGAGLQGVLGARLVGHLRAGGHAEADHGQVPRRAGEGALNLPDVMRTLTETLGMDLQASSPEVLQKWLLGEMQRWSKVVKDNGIRPD